jgi:hypothetical protein
MVIEDSSKSSYESESDDSDDNDDDDDNLICNGGKASDAHSGKPGNDMGKEDVVEPRWSDEDTEETGGGTALLEQL